MEKLTQKCLVELREFFVLGQANGVKVSHIAVLRHFHLSDDALTDNIGDISDEVLSDHAFFTDLKETVSDHLNKVSLFE